MQFHEDAPSGHMVAVNFPDGLGRETVACHVSRMQSAQGKGIRDHSNGIGLNAQRTQQVLHCRASGLLVALPCLLACVDTSVGEEAESDDSPIKVTVTVDPESTIRTVPPWAYGMHASVYDNSIQSPTLPSRLEEAGISMLRWPGGGYSDNYHWATHSMTAWPPEGPDDEPDFGYLAPDTDFGSFVRVIDRTGVGVMITVNYGSNFVELLERESPWQTQGARSSGPGEPKEAAAWVAYANGDPDDETEIGVDSVGNDWKTVGYWASLRAAEKLDQTPNDEQSDDDGLDFLRISRPEPLNIRYWEVGNEIFGNGYHGTSFNLDLSYPYDGSDREGEEALSGTAYGEGVVEYVQAMKAVDPDIEIGAVLVTPPDDYAWGRDWNDDVLRECGEVIDFGIIHWYPNHADFLGTPSRIIPRTFEELQKSFQQYGGDNADDIGVAVTELGPAPGHPMEHREISGLFAADAYLTYIEYGAFNIDWLELHNGTFLWEQGDRRGPAFHGIRAANIVADAGEQLIDVEADKPGTVRAHAGLGDDGEVRVMLINRGRHRDAEVVIEGLGDVDRAQLFRYDAYGPENGRSDGLEGPETIQLDEPISLPWRTLAVLVVAD